MQSPHAKNTANGKLNSNISEQDVLRRTTRVLRQLYHREKQWLSSRTEAQLSSLTQQGQLSLSEQMHYGEVAFVLLHLKPCAIIDFADDREQLDDYVRTVIQPTLCELNALGPQAQVLHRGRDRPETSSAAWYPREFKLVCSRVAGQMSSPEVASWTGAYVLYDELWAESREWAQTCLLDPKRTTVSEDELARGLDYPGSIPKTSEDVQQIVPVSYLGRMKSESGEWMSDRWECLTSFIVLQHELPQTALHRIRYQAIQMFDIEMQVTMDTSMIEQFPMS